MMMLITILIDGNNTIDGLNHIMTIILANALEIVFIKTHINGTKALQEAIKKLDTEQTNFRNLAVFKVLKEAN